MPEVVVVATIVPKPGAAGAVKAAFLEAIPGVHSEEGCLVYTLNQRDDDTLVTIEKWASADDLQTHADGPGLKRLFALIGDKLVSPPDITTMAELPAGDPVKGAL